MPQLLRYYGILEYRPELAKKVDNYMEIMPGSKEEVEIRAATVCAVELISQAVKKQIPQACPARIDGILWQKSQVQKDEYKPYHRTRTIWY